jgi:heme-degrading monooxygenase HmoA
VYVIVWKYQVAADQRAAFEAAYGNDGVWARFFQRGSGYRGTELLGNESGAYLTIDRWESQADCVAFRASHGAEYERIDADCAALTLEESLVGAFEA